MGMAGAQPVRRTSLSGSPTRWSASRARSREGSDHRRADSRDLDQPIEEVSEAVSLPVQTL